MPYKTIVINADSESALEGRLRLAMGIAERFKSHVIALAYLPPPLLIAGGVPGAPDIIAIEGHRDALRAAAERMRGRFEAHDCPPGVGREWMLVDTGAAGTEGEVAEQFRLADLIVSGGPAAGWDEFLPATLSDRLTIESGRPVLLVPRGPLREHLGQRVLVAWNGSREAARALYDALPLLASAGHLSILRIVDAPTVDDADRRSLARVGRMLERHGIKARLEATGTAGGDLGATLLAAAHAEKADLLVMGCYGHSPLREFVLGGATRHVLHHMDLAVLMSH